MQNPLLSQRRSALDLPAAHGMNNYEWMVAKARMEQALMLGNATLRLAERTRVALRRAAIVLFGAPGTRERA